MKLRVSVLMSVFNGGPYLQEAVESVLTQTLSDFEFLIVDDASTDGTREYLRSLSDSRIVLLENEENIGLTASLNKGLLVTKGDLVARLDADDVCSPRRLEFQQLYMDKHPECGMVASDAVELDSSGNVWPLIWNGFDSTALFYHLHFSNCLVHSSVCIRKVLLNRVGGYNPKHRVSQDYGLWVRLMEIAPIHVMSHALVGSRKHRTTISETAVNEQRKYAEEIALSTLAGLRRVNVDETFLEFVQGRRKGLDCSRMLEKMREVNDAIVCSLDDLPFTLDKDSLRAEGEKTLLRMAFSSGISNALQQLVFHGGILFLPELLMQVFFPKKRKRLEP